jgi:FKBP-type peptidyl-prolyl cis-trans isomerase 2
MQQCIAANKKQDLVIIMLSKKYFIPAILLVLAVVLVAGCAGTENTVKNGDNVTLDYIGTYDNGTIFDTSNATIAQQAGIYESDYTYGPISFISGDGEVFPAIENATIGMKIGETKNVTLTPADAYGEYNASLIQPVPLSVLEENNITPHVNDTLYYNLNPVRVDHIVPNVTDPNNTSVYIDFNDPRAGKTMHFQLTIVDIKAATNSST